MKHGDGLGVIGLILGRAKVVSLVQLYGYELTIHDLRQKVTAQAAIIADLKTQIHASGRR